MRIEVTGLNVEVTDDLREHVERRFEKVARLVSELATCDVTLSEERNPRVAAPHKAEANVHLKGARIHAKEHAADMKAAISEVAEEIGRQVDKRRERTRGHRKTGTPTIRRPAGAESPLEAEG
jgi:putative sigma-54 modulation protein